MKSTLAVNNELIKKRRKKNAIKKAVLILGLLTAVLVTLCLKLSYFNLEDINIVNNKLVASENIVTSCKLIKGTNIFYINTKKVRTNVLNNPYILEANVKRVLPNSIRISVKEREAVFFIENNNKFIIIDKYGIILEIRDNIDNMKLTKLEGFEVSDFKIGTVIPFTNKTQLDNIAVITDLITLNSSEISITSVNLSDPSNVQIYCGNMLIKLGYSNIKDKLNKAFNLMIENNYNNAKGYIDFSSDSNPTVYIEK